MDLKSKSPQFHSIPAKRTRPKITRKTYISWQAQESTDCTKENATQVETPRTSPTSSSGNHLTSQHVELVLYVSLILVLVGYML
ncbi:hypothetical protein OSB04_018508 [Centaurea solstitialis]|uniref:Uncharacterized protein n=1 Tax=Centaurea solstitialis TaxID=347529 RepID=A0AA38TCJ0_9ASTR|nr:hypothetical protein OSB04_018508 [Centaurea solstitialis]